MAPEILVREQARILYMQALVSNATVIAISLLFFFLLSSRVDSDLIGFWVLALCCSALVRVVLWYLRKSRPDLCSAESWLRYYLLASGLVGVSWSLIYPLIYVANDPVVLAALSMLIFGVLGSAVVILHIYFPAFVLYTYPQILSLLITFQLFQDDVYHILSLAILIYLVMTTLFARNVNRNSLNSIALQYRNAALVDELSQEVGRRESLIEQRTGELHEKNAELTWEIGERERAEIALRESEQRLVAFFGSSPAGMGLLDKDLRYLLVNATLAKMHGLTPEENTGKTLAEVLPRGLQAIEPIFRRILETNEPVINLDLSGEVPSRPDEISHFTVSYFPIPGITGEPGGIGIVVIDITERKRAEEQLRLSEERFGLAMRGTKDGVYDWNLVSNEIYYSPRWKQMLGYADDELKNDFTAWESLVDVADRKRSWGMLTDYINARRSNFKLEFKMRHKDGHWVDILSRAFLVRDDTGKAVRVVGTHVDISEEKHWQNALRDSEEYLRVLSRATYEAIILFRQGRCMGQNPAAEKMFGHTVAQAAGKEIAAWIAPEFRELVNTYLISDAEEPIEALGMHRDGGVFSIEIQNRMMSYKGEQVSVIAIRDISERKSREEKIRLLSQALEQSPVLVVITDKTAKIEYVNSTFERVTGYTAEEVIGRNPSILKSGLTPLIHYQELWKALGERRSWTGELQNRKKSGEFYWEQAHIAPVVDPAGKVTHYLAVKEDITEKKSQEERIIHQAHYDGLTNLPNRFLALDRLTQLIKEAARTGTHAAVLFLDLDGFKRINDSLGHETGDQLLRQSAGRLTETVREGDTVCRLGGDEFIVLLSSLKQASDARSAAESLVSRFRQPFVLDERELLVTASIGIAVYPQDGATSAELLRNADTAMYHSKEQGRNSYHYFTETMNKDVSRRLAVEEQLHGALGRQEFFVMFQPVIDLQNSEIAAAEALLRWRNPTLGDVSPEEFIPIAEQTGSIVEIGHFVLRQALGCSSQWQKTSGKGFKMAVNLSPRQFRDPGLTDSIKAALQQAGVAAESLELEITEGVLMSGHAYLDAALTALNELGVGIAMDDFGTGYSSLSYLRSYPFDVLKVDRSFISDITVDQADRELVNAAILMAHGLGLKVVAEGVETREQLAYLREKNCEFAQGYLFSKPISAEEFSVLLEVKKSPDSSLSDTPV